MGEVFKPGETEGEKIKKLAKELQISEERAEEILKKRKLEEKEK